MKFSSKVVLAILVTCVSHAYGYVVVPNTEYLGEGFCKATNGGTHDFSVAYGGQTALSCDEICRSYNDQGGLRGFEFNEQGGQCVCRYDDGTSPKDYLGSCPPAFSTCDTTNEGSGPLVARGAPLSGDDPDDFDWECYQYEMFPAPLVVADKTPQPPTTIPDDFPAPEVTGDPHFRTFKNEHFEFHGQCDLVMTKVQNFANKEGIDLEIQLRTSIVRYWSYVKTAAIRIGTDILEVEGSAAKEDGIDKRHYHINFEHLGPLTHLGGYPVTISPRNNKYTIDLDKDYPGLKIEIKTFKEFVGVKIIGATEESFGNAIGIMGDFKTGNTYGRDGSTVLHDFNELGLEWQVLPSDGKLFHEIAKPQFPELCYLPEDPRGERARRLAESDITEEAAEAACASLKDDFDRKGCVYDILATQDLDMVGAY
ncbi:unnamed protein product [Cylindrotheca closterium]|uniref:VWFD domain-containing protein n=1 Tax=Cylindrotheca closterium TaxID=2856 RepID=A0AAD2FVI2_9STRA|nr:unnamed protein product [Cylindrotheca closterium]